MKWIQHAVSLTPAQRPCLLLVTLLVGHAQLVAAFGAAALNHVPAIGGGHALHKSVFVAALALGGLVGAFHLSFKFIALKTIGFSDLGWQR